MATRVRHATGLDWAIGASAESEQERLEARCLVCPRPAGTLVAMVDGIGMGRDAVDAERHAIESLRLHAASGAIAIVRRCHEALIGTRGVALGLVLLDVEEDVMTWIAIGPVTGVLIRALPASPRWPPPGRIPRGDGVVGVHLPVLRAEVLALAAGDQVLLAGPGLRSAFGAADSGGIVAITSRPLPPSRLAERLVLEQGRPGDDTLVLVGRYRGRARVRRPRRQGVEV